MGIDEAPVKEIAAKGAPACGVSEFGLHRRQHEDQRGADLQDPVAGYGSEDDLRATEKDNYPILHVFWPRLFGASMRLTPSGLARKSVPDRFFVVAERVV